MIRWLCGHISPTVSSQGRYSRWRDHHPVRPDGNNVDGPSHATYRDCTTASRSNSPNYKIIILRLAPPGNTRDQPGLYSPLGLVRHLLRVLSSFLFSSPLSSLFFHSFPFPFPFLAPSFHLPPSCSIRPLVDPRWFADWMLRTFAAKDHRSFLADRDYFKLINPSPVFGLGLQCFVVERFRHSTAIQRIIIGIIVPVISFWKISSSY